MTRLLIAIVCVLFSVVSASAQNWQAQFDTLIQTPPGPERDSLIKQIVASGPNWGDVMDKIGSVAFPDTTRGQALSGSTTCIDGVTRPYVIYVPSTYNHKTPAPMLVHLHGLVNRPDIDPNPNEYVGNTAMMAEAEKRGWLVLFPFGQKGATWFDDVGMTNVTTLVRAVKENFNVDDDRVYMSGLSDGASAAFMFAMIMPTDFASFVSLNGDMGGAGDDGGYSLYAPNMTNSYIYVTTADLDAYFPTAKMERTISMAGKAGAKISYQKLTGEHISSVAKMDYAPIFDYLEQHPRNSSPDTIVWETAARRFGACKWLAIDGITIDEPAPWHVDHNVAMVDSGIHIGFFPADTFSGPGVMVASVVDEYNLARRVGLQPGDIIIKENDSTITDWDGLDHLWGIDLRYDANINMTVRRGGNEVVLRGRVPGPNQYFLFKRDKPSALAKVAFSKNRFDMQGSRVGAFRILIDPDMIDLNKNVVVIFNGERIFDDRVAPDIAYMLRDYLANRNRKLVFVNEIKLKPAK